MNAPTVYRHKRCKISYFNPERYMDTHPVLAKKIAKMIENLDIAQVQDSPIVPSLKKKINQYIEEIHIATTAKIHLVEQKFHANHTVKKDALEAALYKIRTVMIDKKAELNATLKTIRDDSKYEARMNRTKEKVLKAPASFILLEDNKLKAHLLEEQFFDLDLERKLLTERLMLTNASIKSKSKEKSTF